MDITLITWSNEISFHYEPRDTTTGIDNIFTDNFVIEKIITNPEDPSNHVVTDTMTFRYTPYQIPCEWWTLQESENTIDTWVMNDELLLVARVNNSRNYCFVINKNNCRLMEVSREKCNIEEFLLNN